MSDALREMKWLGDDEPDLPLWNTAEGNNGNEPSTTDYSSWYTPEMLAYVWRRDGALASRLGYRVPFGSMVPGPVCRLKTAA